MKSERLNPTQLLALFGIEQRKAHRLDNGWLLHTSPHSTRLYDTRGYTRGVIYPANGPSRLYGPTTPADRHAARAVAIAMLAEADPLRINQMACGGGV